MPLYNPAPSPDKWVGPYSPADQTTTTAWAVANQARLSAVTVSRAITTSTMTTRIGIASGNIDAGIYDDNGNRLASTGSIACPTAAVTVTLTLTSSVTLSSGQRYWFALCADNTTVTFSAKGATGTPPSVAGRINTGTVSSSFPLPATIVLPTSEGVLWHGIWV